MANTNRELARLYDKEYYRMHREEKRAYAHEHHHSIPESRQEWNTYMRNYYQVHKHKDEKKMAYAREYYKSHRKEYRAYWQLHPEEMATKNERRRSRKLNAGGSHNTEEWKMIKAMYGNQCLSCKHTNIKLARDHVIPLIAGGTNCIGNIQPLCQSCNSKKHTAVIDFRPNYYWADWT